MILTPEEQTEYREEIDYLIETKGYEYVWGNETAMDKTKNILRDAPGKILEGINKVATNPTVIGINEKLKAHAANLNAQDAERERNRPTRRASSGNRSRTRRQPDFQDGFDFGNDHL